MGIIVTAVDISRWAARFKDAPRNGFILDFDGTLSRIVVDPLQANLVDGAAETLEALAEKFEVVALVSGREATDLAGRVGVRGLRYIGLYGAEEWTGESVIRPPDADLWHSMASRLARDAEAMLATEGLEGCEVEFKDLAVSIHFRNATDSGAPEAIRAWAEPAAQRRRFQVGTGRKVIELRPIGVSKAGAFERVVLQHDLNLVLLGGDDQTDVEAMIRAGEMMQERVMRVGVHSGEEPSGLSDAADVLVGSPERFVELLRQFL